jgi:hypothetical protein
VHCLLKIPIAADYGYRQRDDVEHPELVVLY